MKLKKRAIQTAKSKVHAKKRKSHLWISLLEVENTSKQYRGKYGRGFTNGGR